MKVRLCCALAMVVATVAVIGCRTSLRSSQKPFDIVQMCDPQFGMGGYEDDMRRFDQAIKQVNAIHPDLVVICGDLVNKSEKPSFADFNSLKSKLKVPCYCAPGNHDVGNNPTPRLLAQYRECIGKDYYSFAHKGYLFVVANTQLWKAPLAGESEKHDAWFKQTLEAAAVRKQPIIVVTHFPIFVKNPSEEDTYYNLPIEKRKELLDLCKRCGVVAVISGHTHTTNMRDFEGIQMVCSQNTCKNFDKQPFGFRVWHITPERPYKHEFVPLGGGFNVTNSARAEVSH
jgi:3',5'-cyclic AMP phosphodiesterase CpdA